MYRQTNVTRFYMTIFLTYQSPKTIKVYDVNSKHYTNGATIYFLNVGSMGLTSLAPVVALLASRPP